MWLTMSLVLLIVSFIKGNVDILIASGIFAVAASVGALAEKIRWKQ